MADEPAATQASTRAEVLRASPALFEARTLDRLTRVHPAVVPLIFGPAVVVFGIRAFYHLSVLQLILRIPAPYRIWTVNANLFQPGDFPFDPDRRPCQRLRMI